MWNFHLYPIQEISFYTQYRKFPSKMYQIGNKLCILYKLYKSHSLQGLVYMLYYSIQQYVIKFVSDLRHDGGFLPVLRFLQPNKTDRHDIAEILEQKPWLAWNQNNVSKLSEMFMCGLLFQWANGKNQLLCVG
jgi:hypothetical protein